MDGKRLGDDRTDRHPRIQRRVGILKDNLHVAAFSPKFFAAQRQEIDAIETNTSAVGLDQTKHRPACSGFSAARFTDQSECLTLVDGEADIVDCFHVGRDTGKNASPDRKIFLEMLNA
jgi:hypothetical protein